MKKTRGKQSMSRMRLRLFSGTAASSLWMSALAAAAVGSAAHAQSKPPASPASDGSVLGEIVVTAQRREQSMQDVPLAVSAFSGQTLAQTGIGTTEQLTQLTPGLNFTRTAFFAQPYIRGVGSETTSVGDELNVATYVDNVYITQQEAGFYDLLNVQRVEVLKGPQGTLFGRNATGGAINITTEAPSQTPEFRLKGTYGRFNERMLQAYASGGLADGFAASLAATVSARDGYLFNAARNEKVGDNDSYMLRGRVRYEPNDWFRLDLIGDVSHSFDPTGLDWHIINRNSAAEPLGFNTTSTGFGTVYMPLRQEAVLNQYGGSAEINLSLDPFDIVSVTAYRRLDFRGFADSDAVQPVLVQFQQNNRSRDVEQDFRLVSKKGSKIDWLVGAFYLDSNTGYNPLLLNLSGIPGNVFLDSSQQTKSYAFYGDTTIPLFGGLSISGGLRYSHEKKTLTPTGSIPDLGVLIPAPTRSVAFDSVTPRAVLSYKPNDDLMLYASYSKGFKSGGFNQSSLTFLFSGITPPNFTSTQDPPYRPEKLRSFEVGTKWTLHWLRGGYINMAAFDYDYQDLQVQRVNPVDGTADIENAASAKMRGVDIDGVLQATPDLTLRFGLSYLHARYDSWPDAAVNVALTPCPASTPVGAGCGNANAVVDVSGLQMRKAPTFTANFGFSYDHDLPAGFQLRTSANVYYNTGFPWDPNGRLRQSSYFLTNGQLEVQSPDKRWAVAVWGKNLSNAKVFSGVVESTTGDVGEYQDPRTYGVTVSYRY